MKTVATRIAEHLVDLVFMAAKTENKTKHGRLYNAPVNNRRCDQRPNAARHPTTRLRLRELPPPSPPGLRHYLYYFNKWRRSLGLLLTYVWCVLWTALGHIARVLSGKHELLNRVYIIDELYKNNKKIV